MKKILTVTLNPAVDKTYTTQGLTVGNVNRMRTVMKIAGGKGVNVTKVLRQYGFDVAATGFLGGYSGRFIGEELERIGAEDHFVYVAEETRSNMNILADDGYVTEILEPGPTISLREQEEFLARYDTLLEQCGLVILSGSVAQGIGTDIYEKLVVRARGASVPVYLDSNGEGLRYGMRAKPQLIKPNQKELEYLMGRRLTRREEIVGAARLFLENGIAQVVVSMGARGLLSISGENVLYARTERIEAVNTVGCGDCVVASYAMSYLMGESEEQAIVRACAISAANATTLVSTDIPLETAKELMNKIILEKIHCG